MNLQELKENNIEFVILRHKDKVNIVRTRGITNEELENYTFVKIKEMEPTNMAEYTVSESEIK